MANTVKRISIALSKEDLRQLQFLMSAYGESASRAVKRAMNHLFHVLKEKQKDF